MALCTRCCSLCGTSSSLQRDSRTPRADSSGVLGSSNVRSAAQTRQTHTSETHTLARVGPSLTQLVSIVDPGQELHDPQLEDGVSVSIHGQHHHTCDGHVILMRVMYILGVIIHILHTQKRKQTIYLRNMVSFDKIQVFSNLDTTHIVVKTRGSTSVIVILSKSLRTTLLNFHERLFNKRPALGLHSKLHRSNSIISHCKKADFHRLPTEFGSLAPR